MRFTIRFSPRLFKLIDVRRAGFAQRAARSASYEVCGPWAWLEPQKQVCSYAYIAGGR